MHSESAAAFAEALRLPAGTLPDHLLPGAASAVTPVIAGLPFGMSTQAPRALDDVPTRVGKPA